MCLAGAAELAIVGAIGIDADAGEAIRRGDLQEAEDVETGLVQIVIAIAVALLEQKNRRHAFNSPAQ